MRLQRYALALGVNLSQTVAAIAAEQNGRQKHQPPRPSTTNFQGVKITSKNCGRYSRRCPYIKWGHTPITSCWAVIVNGGKTLAGRIQSHGFKLAAPTGYSFGSDTLGLRLVGPSGFDWHFSASDILDGETGRTLAAKIRSKLAQIAEQKRAEKLAKAAAIIRDREIATTRVTLADSLRAGNCAEGTLVWVERRLGVSRVEVLAAAHLFSVSAGRVLASGEPRARAAAMAAWDRETVISI